MTTERMKRRNLFVRMVLILLILAMPLTSCAQTEPTGQGTETTKGKSCSDHVIDIPPNFFRWESEKSEFDIDDVTLRIYYGTISVNSDFPYESFDLAFANEENDFIFIRHQDECFNSEKYRVTVTYEEDEKGCIYISNISYNYSEMLTIPEKLFSKDSGVIIFALFGTQSNVPEPEYGIMNGSLAIDYKKINGKIRLTERYLNPS